MLLARGARINDRTGTGKTPLHNVVWGDLKRSTKETIRIAELLISNGADVNAEDKYGLTVLDEALAEKKDELAKLLRAYGAVAKRH